MKGCSRQISLLIGLIFACVATCALVYFVPSTIYCEQRKNPPNAPNYPGSTLTKVNLDWVGLDYSLFEFHEPYISLATYEYSVAASPEQIVEFYGGIPAGEYHIIGAAKPFGEFNVGIPSQADDGVTEFFVEVRWSRC